MTALDRFYEIAREREAPGPDYPKTRFLPRRRVSGPRRSLAWDKERIIYAILRADTHEIKIGICWDLADRLRNLQCASGEPLVLLGSKRGPQSEEHAILARFAQFQKLGEWFHDVPEIRAWIEAEMQSPIKSMPNDGRSSSV